MKKNVIAFVIYSQALSVFSAFSSDAIDAIYNINWSNGNEGFKSVASIKNNELMVYSENINTNTRLWFLKDGVYDCPVDVVLEVVGGSFEAVDLFNNGNRVVLFAYRIGCVGDPSPVDFNYIAYFNGTQYSLRGSETIISDGHPIHREGDNGPQPDLNLKKQPLIYKYMMSRWGYISVKNIEN